MAPAWIIFALPLPIFAPVNSTDSDIIRNFPLQTECTFDFIADSQIYHFVFVVQIYQLITTRLGNCDNDVFFFWTEYARLWSAENTRTMSFGL